MYLKKYNLKGKYSLVTGAGKGLGRACAIALAEAGSNLILISRTKKDLDSVSKIAKIWFKYLSKSGSKISQQSMVQTLSNQVIQKLIQQKLSNT